MCAKECVVSDPTGIYIHLPFCVSRCAYCDFFSTVPEGAVVKDAYGERVLAVLQRELETLDACSIVSVYLGGGSPSTMPREFFRNLAIVLREEGVEPLEFTVEANPADLTGDFIETLVSCGVNRLSIGVQAADDAVLAAMGRRASRKILEQVLPRARRAFGNLSYDLIYGFGKKRRDLAAELEWLFGMAVPDHLSAYCYTRPKRRGAPPCADEAVIEAEEEVIRNFLQKHHFVCYEVSNWARKGFESVHNRLYWTWEPYIGIGAGAHGFDPREGIRYRYPEKVSSFINRPRKIIERLPQETLIKEFVMLALRTVEGVSVTRVRKLFGCDLRTMISPLFRERFVAAGYARMTKTRLAATPEGFSVLNTLTAALFGDIERFVVAHGTTD